MTLPIENLLSRLDDPRLAVAGVIPWSCPVPSFGNVSSSLVATLGLNPSNREFVDAKGNELDGPIRRFETLNSLKLKRWSDATSEDIIRIRLSCQNYFMGNPYDSWFKELDSLLGGIFSYYYREAPRAACHLDIIPFATTCKWTALSPLQRAMLVNLAGDTLGLLLQESSVKVLVLNGQAVVRNIEEVANVRLGKSEMPGWTLPRRVGPGVKGIAYKGVIESICGVKLGREITVIGFNHNIQSSFGVSNMVKANIRQWIRNFVEECIS